MSAFLGPIHYWLYNKILWQEALLEEIIELAKAKNISLEETLTTIYTKYGAPDFSPLEEVIDNGNIHGWLQTRIKSVEYRVAALVTELVKHQEVALLEIVSLYSDNGKKAAKAITSEIRTPQDLFKLVFDFMLEGMPCDRVNEVVSESETEILWETTACLHKAYWDAVEGDVKNFYLLQEAWISSFVHAADNQYYYAQKENGLKSINKR